MKHFQKVLLYVMSVQIGFCAVADAAPERSFWKKFWCGDLTTSNATRERRLDSHLTTLKGSTPSFYDSLRWELVQLDTLEQYLGTLKDGIQSGLVLARNADTEALALVFRQKWSQLSRFSIPIEDFEKGADYVIRRRTELAQRNPKAPFDPKVVENLKLQYRYYQAFLLDYPLHETVVAKSLFFEVNDLAFQAELAGIQNTIGYQMRFGGVLDLADGIPGKNPYIASMKKFGITSLDEKKTSDWALERVRQWGESLDAFKDYPVEQRALHAFRAVNYEALKYVFMGPVSRAGVEMDLAAFSTFLDELSRFVRNHSFRRTDEFWDLIRIVEKTESGLDDFWLYSHYADSKYRERLKLLAKELRKKAF